MNDLKAVYLEYIDHAYYSSLFMNNKDNSLKIICYTEKFPDINGIKKLIQGCLKDEEKDKHIILGIVTSINTLFKSYESHTYWNCLLLETSMKNQAQIIMDSLKLESLQQAKPCTKSYIFKAKNNGYAVIEIQPDHSFMDIDLTVKTCKEVFIASTKYKQKIYLPNISRNELNSIMRCLPISPRDLSKTLIGYTSRKDYTHFHITNEYRQLLQEITEAADMVIVDDRAKFSKYSKMQYASLVTYRPLYKLTLDTNSGQYTFTEDTEWLKYRQELDDFKKYSHQVKIIKHALQEFKPIGKFLEQKISIYQCLQKSLKKYAETEVNQIFEKRKQQTQSLMKSAEADILQRIANSKQKIDELYAEATKIKEALEAADRLSKITTTEFTGHILTIRGKRLFTATSSSADTKELLTALQNLGLDKEPEIIPFYDLKIWNDQSVNEPLLLSLNYYVLPISYDLLRNEDHGYNILLNHVREIYANKDWKTNVIPVNIQELTTQDWKNMLDIYEPKIGKAQILDLTCTNNTKPALTFNDLMNEALSEKYDAHEKDTSNYRQAFKYNVFISYRQKDRLLAQSLIQRLLQDPELKEFGFWYDVHLEAGYNFEQQIIDEIDNADIAIMLVTDNILKSNAMLIDENGYLKGTNYISQHEYPYMCSNKNLKIIPVAYEMRLDVSTLKMMNEVSHSALESHGVDIGNADNYSDIVYYKEKDDKKFYAMFPKADNVENLIHANEEKSIEKLINKIKEICPSEQNAFIETTENKYMRAQAYYTGTRTEKNQEMALKIWEDIYDNDKNSTYGLKAQEMLLKLYINKINENIDLTDTTKKLTRLITHKLNECKAKLKSEQYFTKEFAQNYDETYQDEDEDQEQDGSNTTQTVTEIDQWYNFHPLDHDKFNNIILTPDMNMSKFKSSSIILHMDILCKSFLGRIQYIEQFLEYTELLYSLSHEQQTGDSLKNQANIKFYQAIEVINKDIYPAIFAMLRSLMALRTGIEIDNIKNSDVRKEDNRGHKEYAYTFKSIYSNNKVKEYRFGHENILCTIWACLKIMQEKCLRFKMIMASKNYKTTRDKTTLLQNEIKNPGLKRFNILHMLAILKDAPTRALEYNNGQLHPGPEITHNSTIEEDVKPKIYKKLSHMFDNERNYTDSVSFEAWLNDELNKVSDQNIDINKELTRVQKDNVTADEQEEIPYRTIRFWEETHHHATRYAYTAYEKYANKYESYHKPEDLIRKSELMLIYKQYDMELSEETLNSLFEAEQDAWSAYKYSSLQMDDNMVTSQYIKLMQNCIDIFSNGIKDDAIAKDNTLLNLFLDNAIEHLTVLQMRNRNEANHQELCKLTDGLLFLAEHCPSRKDVNKSELKTLEALKNNDITQETSRFLLEKDYLNQANSRSTLYTNRDSSYLARITYNLLHSSNTQKGVVANYDAYKNLRYCLSVLESAKTGESNTEEYTYLPKIESNYRQLHDKWVFYNDDRITFIKNLSKVEQDMQKLSEDEKLESLQELMKQNTESFGEKKWDNSDATMLSSHIGKMIKKLNSTKTEEGIYSRFISDYCYPYLDENLENQKVFSDYIQNENQRLIDLQNNAEYTGTDAYAVRINHMRRLMMTLLENNEYLQLQNVLNVYDLKREYYRLSKCTPYINILPKIFDKDITQLEEMYRLEYTPAMSYWELCNNLQAEDLHSAYINPFCSDEFKNRIRNHVAVINKKHAPAIFWLFEDILSEECKNAYKQFRSNDYDPFELINHSGIITDLKEDLINDTWNFGNIEHTRKLSLLYPSIVRNIIPPHISTMLNTFHTITNTYSFIKNEEVPLLLECIKQLIECDVASILEVEITDYVYLLEKIQNELNLYFPIISPIQKKIWIRMLYMILKDQNQCRNIPAIEIKARKTSQMLTTAEFQAPFMNKHMLIWCTIYGFLNNNDYTTQAFIKYEDDITNLLKEECNCVSNFISSPHVSFNIDTGYRYNCNWNDFDDEYEEQNPWNGNTITFDTSPFVNREETILHLPADDIDNEELMNSAQEAYDQFFNSTLYLRENHIPIDTYANIVIRNFFKTYIPVLKWNSMNTKVPQNRFEANLERSYKLAYMHYNEVAMLNDVLNIPIMLYADRNEIIKYRKDNSYDDSVNLIKHVIELNRNRIESFKLADTKARIEKLPDSIKEFTESDFYKIQPDLNDYGFSLTSFLKTWKNKKGDNNQL